MGGRSPRLDGVEMCRILRRESDVPIIMLTAREAHDDRILGLESGADDYIVKPFASKEVIARAEAVLRRVKGTVQNILMHNNIMLNETTRRVTVDGEPVPLRQAQDRRHICNVWGVATACVRGRGITNAWGVLFSPGVFSLPTLDKQDRSICEIKRINGKLRYLL